MVGIYRPLGLQRHGVLDIEGGVTILMLIAMVQPVRRVLPATCFILRDITPLLNFSGYSFPFDSRSPFM